MAITFIRRRCGARADADVVLLPADMIAALAAAGVADDGTKVAIGSVRIGAAVHADAPVPDVSTVAALRNALLAADAVLLTRAPTGDHLMQAIARLGAGRGDRGQAPALRHLDPAQPPSRRPRRHGRDRLRPRHRNQVVARQGRRICRRHTRRDADRAALWGRRAEAHAGTRAGPCATRVPRDIQRPASNSSPAAWNKVRIKSSLAGLTRQSILFAKKRLTKTINPRVKPGGDAHRMGGAAPRRDARAVEALACGPRT